MPTLIKTDQQLRGNKDNPPALQQTQHTVAPFEWKEGMYASDIINQKKQYQANLEEEQARAQRMAKLAAYTDFFKALGGFAGGGYATTQQYQPSPYLTKSFGEIDRIRSDKSRSDMYYDELLNKTRQQDYNTQLKQYYDNENLRAREERDADNRANAYNMDIWKTNQSKESRDKTLQQSQKQFDERQAQANKHFGVTSSLAQQRLDKTEKEKTEKNPVIGQYDSYGKKLEITKEQAKELIKQAKEDYKDVMTKDEQFMTPKEKQIISAIQASGASPQNLSAAVALLTQAHSKYLGYWTKKVGESQPASAKQTNSFLPKPSKGVTKKPSLLP